MDRASVGRSRKGPELSEMLCPGGHSHPFHPVPLARSLLVESLGEGHTAVSLNTALALGPQGGRAIPEGQGAKSRFGVQPSVLPAF